MFVVQIDFSRPDRDIDVDDIGRLLAAWYGNGQLLEYQAIAEVETGVRVTGVMPESDSLDGAHANEYVGNHFAASSAKGIQIHASVIGPEPDHDPPCDCGTPSDYVLFTHFVSIEPPLRCLACFGQVPLYRIPRVEPEEYHEVLNWKGNYQACDRLQMNCTVGERFGERQMSGLESALTRQGRAICAHMGERLSAGVYYFLSKGRGRSLAAERRRKCPGCGGDWLLDEPLCNLFAFRCNECRLLSNIAFDVAARGKLATGEDADETE